jgi:hypothetical protein
MGMKHTTKTIYSRSNTCLNQYSTNSVNGYGTKWLIHVAYRNRINGSRYSLLVGTPVCNQVNVTLTDKFLDKCEESERFLQTLNLRR